MSEIDDHVARVLRRVEPMPAKLYSYSLARAAIDAHITALTESGFVIVPREPTKEMLESGAGEVWLFNPDVDGPNAKAGDVWRAMIDEAKK